MKSRDFCFWLQGYLEITNHSHEGLSADQLKVISNHLNLVFKHEIDPSMSDPTGKLQEVHDGNNPEHPIDVGFIKPGYQDENGMWHACQIPTEVPFNPNTLFRC